MRTGLDPEPIGVKETSSTVYEMSRVHGKLGASTYSLLHGSIRIILPGSQVYNSRLVVDRIGLCLRFSET